MSFIFPMPLQAFISPQSSARCVLGEGEREGGGEGGREGGREGVAISPHPSAATPARPLWSHRCMLKQAVACFVIVIGP
jgi:hypothetical protein